MIPQDCRFKTFIRSSVATTLIQMFRTPGLGVKAFLMELQGHQGRKNYLGPQVARGGGGGGVSSDEPQIPATTSLPLNLHSTIF